MTVDGRSQVAAFLISRDAFDVFNELARARTQMGSGRGAGGWGGGGVTECLSFAGVCRWDDRW